MIKYKKNREVLDKAFISNDPIYFDWIATICFYTSLHIIEAKFAENSVDNRTHVEREEKMLKSGIFSKKATQRYKQLSHYSRVARYGPDSINLTLASNSIELLSKIEKELLANE